MSSRMGLLCTQPMPARRSPCIHEGGAPSLPEERVAHRVPSSRICDRVLGHVRCAADQFPTSVPRVGRDKNVLPDEVP